MANNNQAYLTSNDEVMDRPPPPYPKSEAESAVVDVQNIDHDRLREQQALGISNQPVVQQTTTLGRTIRTQETSVNNRRAPLGSKTNYGVEPKLITCQYCHLQTVTDTELIPGACGICSCLMCCLVGLWCGCCLIPLAIPDLNDVEHSCSHCKKTVGFYRSL